MVKNTPRNNKWMRRYRTFFVIGLLILCLQIFLAIQFIVSNKSSASNNRWQPLNVDSEDEEVESNSAKSFDDEDVNRIVLKNKKHEVLDQTHFLKYEELGFIPHCSITTKDAVSAINRARTQKCKQILSNITCLSYADKLYPTELKSLCPSEGSVAFKELGCFKDDKKLRLLNGYFEIDKKQNSPKRCIYLCLQSGFSYAGVQYTYECFCGNDAPPLSSKVPDSSCNLRCPGDQQATCGGYYTVNIYETGIKKFVPQTARSESEASNSTSKIVFLLTLNGRAVRQVRRLLKVLYHSDHYYYIHVDVRQDYLYRELLPLEKILPNVRLTRRRFATIWAGASLLEMLRSCMRELLNLRDWKWDFMLNLSESDFPVKTVTQLTRFLGANKNRNFVKSHGREVQRFITKQGLDKTFVECETRMWRVGDRRLPFGIQMDGGSDWFALSKEFVRYITDIGPDDLVAGLLKVYKYTLLPAESFFHTLLRNSKFCDSYVDNNLHLTNWKRKLGCKCDKHVVDWCGCSPNDFKLDDWPRILSTSSRQLYFARKFEAIINQAVILQLELWLYGLEEPSGSVLNLNNYWQNMYHHQDLGVAPHDGLLTVADSIKRNISTMFYHSNLTLCKFKVNSLLQVHTFHSKDSYKYSLFLLKTTAGEVEVAVKPINIVNLVKQSPLMEQVESLIISSEYDQKEQISRNFLRLLTPFSEPVLVYRFSSLSDSKVNDITCLWISPIGRLQDVIEFTLDNTSLVGFVKPTLKQPLLPGVWSVKLIHTSTLLAEVQFLIMPLEFLGGKPLKNSQHLFSNIGVTTTKDASGLFNKFLPSAYEATILQKKYEFNSKREGGALSGWIDELFSQFYRIEKVCIARKENTAVCGQKMFDCLNTDWSSLAPDPKSAIGIVNRTSGTFDIW